MTSLSDRLAQRLDETARPALARQCGGRTLTNEESNLADSLMEIYGTGEHDFPKVAEALTARRTVAPVSGRTDWDEALLGAELVAINAALDAAYAENGHGA